MRTLLTALALAASITVAACGGAGIDNDEADKIRDHAAEVDAAKEIQDDVNELTNETIDAAKDANIPDEAREQLEAAQEQMNAAADGN